MSSVDDAASSTAIPKAEPLEDEDFSDSEQEGESQSNAQETAQAQKRKGGRKPIYATSEERKQRNRQAQAAFRERRTEYIKQLESTIKHHEETLQSLQQSHRSAADECLMLRYKNSLLERILLEKGVDVQAELRTKTEGSHVLSHPANVQTSAVQRAVMNRQGPARRPNTNLANKPLRPQQIQVDQPPRSHSISSQTMSPTATRSPHGAAQNALMDGKSPQNAQHPAQPRSNSQPSVKAHTSGQRPSGNMQGMGQGMPDGGNAPGYYQPSYQAHLDELNQEYAQGDMLSDENPSDTSNGPSTSTAPSSYTQNFHQPGVAANAAVPIGLPGQPNMQQMQQMQQFQQPHPSREQQQLQQQQAIARTQPPDPNNPMYNMMNSTLDPYDPSLDADPFGLTASMHFPTQFSYQEGALRR